MHKLDSEPNICKLEAVLAEMATSKAPGAGGIPPDVLKCLKGPVLEICMTSSFSSGGLVQYHRIWETLNIITLYKNKGDRSDCNNYYGISLHHRKALCSCCPKRLQVLADRIYTWTPSVVSEHSNQWLTWTSLLDNYKRSAGNGGNLCTLLLLTWQKPLILSTEMDCSRSSTVLGALQSAQYDQLVALKHKRHHYLWLLGIQIVWHMLQSKIRLCTCPNIVWHILCHCWSMLSHLPWRAYISRWGQIAACSTYWDWSLNQSARWNACTRSCLVITQLSHHTPQKTCSTSWTDSTLPANALDS